MVFNELVFPQPVGIFEWLISFGIFNFFGPKKSTFWEKGGQLQELIVIIIIIARRSFSITRIVT